MSGVPKTCVDVLRHVDTITECTTTLNIIITETFANDAVPVGEGAPMPSKNSRIFQLQLVRFIVDFLDEATLLVLSCVS